MSTNTSVDIITQIERLYSVVFLKHYLLFHLVQDKKST